MSMKVDRVGDRRIVWGGNYGNPESEEFKILKWEAKHAVSTKVYFIKLVFNKTMNFASNPF